LNPNALTRFSSAYSRFLASRYSKNSRMPRDSQIPVAYVGLGSNLASVAGSPAQTLLAATDALVSLGELTARSSLYETAPVGYLNQPSFVNAVAAIRTAFEPEALLDALLAIERQYERDRASDIPKGPRTLDLDLLLVEPPGGDGLIYESPTLTLPHPAIADRRFVLAPLAEIAPGLRHPILKKTILELLAGLPADLSGADPNSSKAVRVLPPAHL
jgi:2-amino-4-hydroxy-6-hydroxymethyldihydropteridine diphosphokinase